MQSTLLVVLQRAEGLPSADSNGLSDPYCVLRVDGAQKQKSETIYKNLNPEWNQNFYFNEKLGELGQKLSVEVWDRDTMSADRLGDGNVDISVLSSGTITPFTVLLTHPKTGASAGKLFLTCSRTKESPEEAAIKSKENELKSTSGIGLGSVINNLAKQTTKAIASTMSHKPSSGKGVKRMITVDVIRARGLPAMDANGFADPYVRCRVGKKKHTTKVMFRTLSPEWRERMVFVLFDMGGRDSNIMEVSLWDKDTIGLDEKISTLKVDLSELSLGITDERFWKMNAHTSSNLLGGLFRKTTGKSQQQQGDVLPDVELQLLITVADLFEPALQPDQLALAQKQSKGWLKCQVHQGRDLGAFDSNGKSDPFVVLEVGNRHVRTATIKANLNPVWDAQLEMPVGEIFDNILVHVYDEDDHGKFQLMGSLCLPLLHVENGKKKWYQLKDEKMLKPVQGCIQLTFNLNYLKLPLMLKAIGRRPQKLMAKEQDFKFKLLKLNINRLAAFLAVGLKYVMLLNKILLWEMGSPIVTVAFLVGWILFWAFVQLWHLTLGGFLALLLVGMQKFRGKRQQFTLDEILQTEEDVEEEVLVVEEEEEEEESDTKAAIKNPAGMITQLRQMRVMAATIQNLLGTAASFVERVVNLLSWESPYLTAMVCMGLFMSTLALMFIPFRFWVMLAGINRIVRAGLRKYHPAFKRPMYHIPYMPLIEFVGRVPDHLELEQRKLAELPIELQEGKIGTLMG